MYKNILNGVYPAIITPFDEAGQIDTGAITSNIKRWNEYGLRGYVVAGSTGEAPLLSDLERKKLIQSVKESMNEGMMLLAGTGRETTALTIDTCKMAAAAGVDAALVITPWFYKPLMTNAALEKHFLTVAEASPIPILLYNMPSFTGVNISLGSIAILAQHPNIIGVKDSSGDAQKLATTIRKTPDDFSVFVGRASMLAQAFMSGVSGAILAVANLAPEICVALYRASEAQNFGKVQHLNNLLQSISEVTGGAYGIGGLKYAMRLLNYAAGSPRPPLLSPSKAQKQEIIVTLQKAGLLEEDN